MTQFVVEQTAVREAGESPAFDCGEEPQTLTLTLGITHALERESIDVLIFDSRDGVRWKPAPLAHFTPKYYCGVYKMTVLRPHERYLRAMWRMQRWGDGAKPYFGFYLQCAAPVVRELTLAAI